MFENFIKFKVGDLVINKLLLTETFKAESTTPIGAIYPMLVIEVIPDRDWDNRIGESGNSNLYRCVSTYPEYSKSPINKYQGHLIFWNEAKEVIINQISQIVKELEEIE